MEDNNMILDLLLILAKRKRTVFVVTLIASIFIVTFSLIVDEKWTSTAVIEPITESSGGLDLGSIGSSLLGGLSGNLTGGQTNEGDKLIAIIKSRPFLEDLIAKFDLYNYYKLNEQIYDNPEIKRDLALDNIRGKMLSVKYVQETNFLYISVTTKGRDLSPNIANYIVESLDNYNKNIRNTKAKESRIFLQDRISLVEQDITKELDKLTDYKKSYNVIDIVEQTKAITSVYSDLVTQKIKKQLRSDYLKKFVKTDNQKIKNLDSEIKILNYQIKKLESGKDSKYLLALNSISDIGKEIVKHEANLKIGQSIYEYLYPQLELAKLEESKQSTTLDIIETAVLSGLRSWPKRGALCIAVWLATLISTSFYVIFQEKLKKYLSENAEVIQKMNEIKHYAKKI
jgi:capsule polysaccharide export protein KpsE/RkpR